MCFHIHNIPESKSTLNLDQTKAKKAGVRISLALALSVMLFLPAASADSTITLTSPNAQHTGYFGSSVAINEGDPLVVVGAPGETANTFPGAGHAYVLDTTTGLIITLTSPNAQLKGGFGSVAVSGTTVVVGAYGETANGHSVAGHAYVFDAIDGSLITTLTSPNAQADGDFGGSVSISGTLVVVGALGEAGNAGHAYVFNATDGSLITTLTSPNTNALVNIFFFGASVSISGTTVVVGAYDDTTNGIPTNEGHAYVFDATDGSLIATLTSPNANANIEGRFGLSVSISGTTVVVGAPYERPNAVLDAGRAYVFDSTGSLIATLTSPYAQGPQAGLFGSSVSVSCTTVVVGAYNEIANGQPAAGHAYSFNATAGFLTTTLTSPNAQGGGNFGSSVAVSGTTVVVGAPSETGSGFFYAGHAYIFP
jgi:hypothetical protein